MSVAGVWKMPSQRPRRDAGTDGTSRNEVAAVVQFQSQLFCLFLVQTHNSPPIFLFSFLGRVACVACDLLLQISHVAWSVCLSVSVVVTRVSCTKMAEPIETRRLGLIHVGPRNHV